MVQAWFVTVFSSLALLVLFSLFYWYFMFCPHIWVILPAMLEMNHLLFFRVSLKLRRIKPISSGSRSSSVGAVRARLITMHGNVLSGRIRTSTTHLSTGLLFDSRTRTSCARYPTLSFLFLKIIYACMDGDRVMATAYSHELPRYGVKIGLTNYPAAYCTGLLLARRVLKKLKLDRMYQGQTEANGENYLVESNDNRGAFKCFLDVGLRRTSSGANIFGALKVVTFFRICIVGSR